MASVRGWGMTIFARRLGEEGERELLDPTLLPAGFADSRIMEVNHHEHGEGRSSYRIRGRKNCMHATLVRSPFLVLVG